MANARNKLDSLLTPRPEILVGSIFDNDGSSSLTYVVLKYQPETDTYLSVGMVHLLEKDWPERLVTLGASKKFVRTLVWDPILNDALWDEGEDRKGHDEDERNFVEFG